MTRRIALLVAAVLLLALGGSLAVHGVVAQEALQEQQTLRNREAAAALALALSAQHGQPQAMLSLAQLQFDQGGYDHMRLRAAGSPAQFDLQAAEPRVGRAPGWLLAALPIDAPPGLAPVRNGTEDVGELLVATDTDWAHDALWAACQRTAVLLAVLAAVAAMLTAWALHAWRQPLQAALAQAQALEQGRFVEAEEPPLPELRPLARSMNTTVRRLRDIFAAQADQVALLQRQAQLDALTALPTRRHCIGQLQQRLAEPGGPGVVLILLRVLQLETLNPRLGHEATDRLLVAIADVLLTYVDRVSGAFAGRLNGSDFALCLPIPGVGPDTADSLRHALAAAPALRQSGVQVAIGASDGLRNLGASAALAAADEALARAETSANGGVPALRDAADLVAPGGASDARGPAATAVSVTVAKTLAHFPLVVLAQPACVADPALAGAWQGQITDALAEGRVQLAEQAVVDAQGRVLHLECPLRVQLVPGGDYQGAARWLALARRSRLLPQLDLAALDLALRAIALDGRARAVQMAPQTLATPGFIADVSHRLAAAPAAARLLSIETAEGLHRSAHPALAIAVAAWRPWGVRVGVLHADTAPQRLPALQAAGVAYVKVSAEHLCGLACDSAVRSYAQSLVALLHGLGLQSFATGMDDAADMTALWALGFDGVSGPVLGGAG